MTNNNKHKLYIPVHFHPFLCEAWEGGSGQSDMDHAYQCGGAGDAQGKNAWNNRYVLKYYLLKSITLVLTFIQ